MVGLWGMSDELGPVSYNIGERDPFLGREIAAPKEYAESTATRIDEAVAQLLEDARQRARTVLEQHRDLLDALADELVAKETVTGDRLAEIVAAAGDAIAATGAGAPASGRGHAASVTAPRATRAGGGSSGHRPGASYLTAWMIQLFPSGSFREQPALLSAGRVGSRRLRRERRSLAPRGAAAAVSVGATVSLRSEAAVGRKAVPSTTGSNSRLRGRRAECEALDALIAGARAGTSGALVLRGPAGDRQERAARVRRRRMRPAAA